MQYGLLTFEYEDQTQVRTVEVDGEPWFYANDVCKALDIKNPRDAITRLDEDDVGTTDGVDSLGRKADIRIVSEIGLYDLILQSRKEGARKFKRWITHDVLPQIRRTGRYVHGAGGNHAFVRRFNDNWARIDRGHFSVISELFIRVYGRFEQIGHVLAQRGPDGREVRPDVAVGQRFPVWLENNHPEHADKFKMYLHLFPNGMEFEARQYENVVLPMFIEYVETEWLPNCAPDYLRSRDPVALAFLPKLLDASPMTKTVRRIKLAR